MDNIRLLLVDDQELFRPAIAVIIDAAASGVDRLFAARTINEAAGLTDGTSVGCRSVRQRERFPPEGLPGLPGSSESCPHPASAPVTGRAISTKFAFFGPRMPTGVRWVNGSERTNGVVTEPSTGGLYERSN